MQVTERAAGSTGRGQRATCRDLVIGLLLAIASIAFVLGILELGMRIRFKGEGPTRVLDSELGWRTKPFVDLTRNRPPFGTVRYTTAQNGFRIWGDPGAPARVLVIGDSFTQALEVSDGTEFYAFLTGCPGTAVFAYGGGGYGTTQEFLVLDRYVDEIRPTVVVWQLSPNDVINNLWELESRSLINNNRMTRPYWESGRIRMRYPSRSFWMRHTMLGRWLASKIGIVRVDRLGAESIEYRLSENPDLLERSLRVTEQVLAAAEERLGDVPIVAFEAEHFDWLGDAFAQIADRLGIVFVPVNAAVAEAKAAGLQVDGQPRDSHWNQNGHRIAGETLRDTLVQRGLLPDSGCSGGAPED
jgi:hypothetical protein